MVRAAVLRGDRHKMRSVLLAVIAAAGASLHDVATASEFDQCVLQHMQGITSDLAAASVKESCLRTVETQLPHEALDAFKTAGAAFGQLPAFAEGGFGLYITLNNTSGYTITELTIQIDDNRTNSHATYVIRDFPFVPPPGTIMGLPRDPTLLKMIGPGPRKFYTAINETTRDVTEWHNRYDWSLISAKGFRELYTKGIQAKQSTNFPNFDAIGAGAVLCANFAALSMQDHSGPLEDIYFAWTQGMMVGLNAALTARGQKATNLSLWDTDQQDQHIRIYCKSNAAEFFSNAAVDLYESMRTEQQLPDWRR
jgi:hypothetical protein